MKAVPLPPLAPAALITADIECNDEDIMYEEARKRLKTAADGSLTTQYQYQRHKCL